MEIQTPAQGDTLFPFKTILFLIFFTASHAFAETPPIHHELTATLPPSQSVTRFHDVVTIPKSIARSISGFHLNKNSKIEQIAMSGKKVSFDVSADGFIKLDLTQHLANILNGAFRGSSRALAPSLGLFLALFRGVWLSLLGVMLIR